MTYQRTYEIRDPIHGFIKITDDERKIIDTKPFQRLRRIRQLGTTYLLYPSAEHTRFQHSIGVMHVSSMIFDRIVEKRHDLLGWGQDQKDRYRQMLRLAALLHDIGHAPFSHVSDEIFDENVKTHEQMAAKIITDSEISSIIEKIGRRFNFTVSDIAAMIAGKVFEPEEKLLVSIFSSELDADKMDYLLRDSLYTGVKYGNYDLDRLLNVITIFPKDGDLYLGIEYDGVQAVEGLILARYFMFTQVYFHRTRRIYDRILLELMKELLVEQYGKPRFPYSVEEFIEWDDNRVIELAKGRNSSWAERFLGRKHMKRIWEAEPNPSKERREVYIKLAKELQERYNVEEVIIDLQQKSPIKFELSDGSPAVNILDQNSTVISYSLKEKAPIVAKLDDAIFVFRVYADAEIGKNVKEKVEFRLAYPKGGQSQ